MFFKHPNQISGMKPVISAKYNTIINTNKNNWFPPTGGTLITVACLCRFNLHGSADFLQMQYFLNTELLLAQAEV